MKLKYALLIVTVLLAMTLGITYHLRQPTSLLPPSRRTYIGVDPRQPPSPYQYQLQVFVADKRPVVAFLVRSPADSGVSDNTGALQIMEQECDSRMTNLARYRGNFALFARDSGGEIQRIRMGAHEFNEWFDPNMGRLKPHKIFFDPLDEIWIQHVAPQLKSASLDDDQSE